MTDAPLNWFDAVRDAVDGVTDAAAFPVSALALARVPKGDGHAILVFPGFMSSDQPTWPLRTFLAQIGYRVYPWGLGINFGFSTAHEYDIEALIEHRLKEVFIESGDRKISLIGWSLGGVYAKVVARRYPHLVRDVITMGSPISGNTAEVSVWRLYEWVTNMQMDDPVMVRKIRETNAPLTGVPITAIYSRKDGVVPWKNACEKPGPLVQNIEVEASHVGMGLDAFVYYVIAHRLAKSNAKKWQPLDASVIRRQFRRQRMPV